jgi:hypothetical protein
MECILYVNSAWTNPKNGDYLQAHKIVGWQPKKMLAKKPLNDINHAHDIQQ